MATSQFYIDTISEEVIRSLGYHRLKEEQRIVINSLYREMACLPSFQLALVKPNVLFVYHPFLKFCRELKVP